MKEEIILLVISVGPCTISDLTKDKFKHPHDNLRQHGDLAPEIYAFLV
jgi:hypothetical protein